MTSDALERECRYETVMYQVKRMFHAGLITEQEFQEIEARFRAKYKPMSGGLYTTTEYFINGNGREWAEIDGFG